MTSCPRCRRSFEEGVRFCPVDGALVTQAVHDPNIDRVLMGQFELREIAGRGAMGTVYRAYQRTMDRIVAVKILRSEIVKEPGVLRRFLREARAAARLQHPNIVTVHMVGETEDGVPYLVMEHIDGVSLEAICEAQGPQPLARVISFGRQIAAALSEAHSLGIVHRDLKPANILITDRSRTPDLVKVLDFGIAKLINTEADQSMMTADGTIFGTPHYIAPEQASGTDVDHRVDIYSLGVILFRVATGTLPFEGTQSMQVVLKHLREEPPRPRSIDASIPQALEDLILACLQKSRNRRPDDAEQVIASLDRIEADARKPKSERLQPVHVTRPTAPASPGSSPAWAAVAPSVTPPGGQRASGPITPTNGHSKMSSTGKIAAMRGAQSPWANRAVWIGVFVAATIGASVGVLAALTHNSAEESVPPAPEHPAFARTGPPATGSTLPAAGVALPSAGGPSSPLVTTTVSPPTVTPIATSVTPAPTKTVARVESPNPVRRRPRHEADDMPMTVVPADPPAQKVVAHPLPTTSSAPRVVSQPAAAQPAPSTTTSAPSTTTPAPAPSAPTTAAPAAPRDEEPPPAPPPPVNDPTTLPPPSAVN
ncbi:MAG TPA: protein kinase [Polyangia bacterium]|nr:protein kinase [Polyangia bacterium]